MSPILLDLHCWISQGPEVKGHAGFRLNALISLFENASWGSLASEYERCRGNPSQLQFFENTVLGKTNKNTLNSVDPGALRERIEDFSLDNIPAEILVLTCGVDCQHDRLELVLLGHSQTSVFVLANIVFHGSTIEKGVWEALDEFLKTKWKHPTLGTIGISATAIDFGGTGTGPESRTQAVYNFCDPRSHRRIYAIAGRPGPRPVWKASQGKGGLKNKLFIVGHDQIKTEVLERPASLPFLDTNGTPLRVWVEILHR